MSEFVRKSEGDEQMNNAVKCRDSVLAEVLENSGWPTDRQSKCE